MESANAVSLVEPKPSLVAVTNVVYALHALSLGVGAFTASSVVGMFLFGWPSVVAVVLNYVYRGDARGTWLESHFEWQIKTFWHAAAWSVAISVISAVLALILIGFAIWFIGIFALGIWAITRIARGWLRLRDREPMTV
jgi:uncharacterized membrane protein